MIPADPRETTPGYRPPEAPEEDAWWVLAAKFAVALTASAGLCRMLGLTGVSTAVIAASFLVASAPVAALRATVLRVLALAMGAALGVVGGVLGQGADGVVPVWYFVVVGGVVGVMASHNATLIYTAAIAAVVAGAGATRTDPLATIVWETSLQLTLGTIVALAVVWLFEGARALLRTD
ncbi:hypothetical protein [Jannaschia sp. LMIT008]|uniref:hypothetical protein n=1 Tax=Jannaschia maritima TaxID=3032585 RepID=UPI002810BC3C|nr:hypothetical protein [Jannaschia sp. LMIT008]